MPWPLSQDYNEAIQNPAACFSDPDLRQGIARTNALGLPVPCSGTFADVYQVRSAAGAWAVKCFTRVVPGLRERYTAIHTHLQRSRLLVLVPFQYLDRGIRVRGHWFPVVKMDWVEGPTLNDFIRQHLDEPHVLENLAQAWLVLARLLRDNDIAHCDLQHGNVLLVPGNRPGSLAIRLVDYDGMYVPALAGRPSGESGHPAYQHPRRLREGVYNGDVDRFPLLLIYCAIRAFIVGGRALWDRYDNGDNLLFHEKDLHSPHESSLFDELKRLNDSEVRWLATCLSRAVAWPVDQTPLLVELIPHHTGPQLIVSARPATGSIAKLPNPRSLEGQLTTLSTSETTRRSTTLLAALIASMVIFLGCIGLAAYIFPAPGQTVLKSGEAVNADSQATITTNLTEAHASWSPQEATDEVKKHSPLWWVPGAVEGLKEVQNWLEHQREKGLKTEANGRDKGTSVNREKQPDSGRSIPEEVDKEPRRTAHADVLQRLNKGMQEEHTTPSPLGDGRQKIPQQQRTRPIYLAFGRQPRDTRQGERIAPPITVLILDGSSHVATTNSTEQITIAISANPSAGVLSGTVTVTAVNGVATFSDLSIDKQGSGYRLMASSRAGGRGVVSKLFKIGSSANAAGRK